MEVYLLNTKNISLLTQFSSRSAGSQAYLPQERDLEDSSLGKVINPINKKEVKILIIAFILVQLCQIIVQKPTI